MVSNILWHDVQYCAPNQWYVMWGWGSGGYGNLGNGDTTNRSSPTQVGALTTWLTVAMGYKSVSAIKTDGTLWSWGANSHGELGIGNTTSYSSPVQVGALTDWLKITAGYEHKLAIKTDGHSLGMGYGKLWSIRPRQYD